MHVKTPFLGRPRFIQEDFLGPMKTANRILDGAANSVRNFGLVEMCEFPCQYVRFPDRKMIT
jgi:hypothetical protein